MSQLFKSLAKSALNSSGVLSSFRLATRRGVRILMYHRFEGDTKRLTEQCEHIRRYYNPVSLTEVADWFEGKKLPDNAVAITVDDGYRDFMRGYEVFRAFDLPVIVYLVSDFIDRTLWLWWNQIEYAFQNTPLKSPPAQLPFNDMKIDLETPETKWHSARRIAEALTQVTNSERLRFLSTVPEMLNVEIPETPPPAVAPLSWPEVRALEAKGVAFGCHTKTHPILSSLKNSHEQEEEIKSSKLRLEQELGKPVDHFCYPNGLFTDFNDDTIQVVAQLGFRTAVTTEPGLNFSPSKPFYLRRLSVDPAMPHDYFQRLLAGAFRR